VAHKLKIKSEMDGSGRRVRYTWVSPLKHVLSRPIDTLLTSPPVRRQASYLQFAFDETETAVDLGLSPELILSRVREFLQSPGEHEGFTPSAEIQGLMMRCEQLKDALSVDDADSFNRLLVLFFELGMHANAVNGQAFESHALDDIRKMPVGRCNSKKTRALKRIERLKAYTSLAGAMSSAGCKLTFGGVVEYLRAQKGHSFSSNVRGCARIWYFPEGDSKTAVFDSQSAPGGGGADGDGCASKSTVDRLMREAKAKIED